MKTDTTAHLIKAVTAMEQMAAEFDKALAACRKTIATQNDTIAGLRGRLAAAELVWPLTSPAIAPVAVTVAKPVETATVTVQATTPVEIITPKTLAEAQARGYKVKRHGKAMKLTTKRLPADLTHGETLYSAESNATKGWVAMTTLVMPTAPAVVPVTAKAPEPTKAPVVVKVPTTPVVMASAAQVTTSPVVSKKSAASGRAAKVLKKAVQVVAVAVVPGSKYAGTVTLPSGNTFTIDDAGIGRVRW